MSHSRGALQSVPKRLQLHQRYADRGLAILSISWHEARGTVESFLKANPHPFPVVLTTENHMPRRFHLSALPTYWVIWVIDREGRFSAAVEGGQGFRALKSLLAKAGLSVE